MTRDDVNKLAAEKHKYNNEILQKFYNDVQDKKLAYYQRRTYSTNTKMLLNHNRQ